MTDTRTQLVADIKAAIADDTYDPDGRKMDVATERLNDKLNDVPPAPVRPSRLDYLRSVHAVRRMIPCRVIAPRPTLPAPVPHDDDRRPGPTPAEEDAVLREPGDRWDGLA
jgi:hypothetical protein